MNKTNFKTLQIIQNNCLRIILDVKKIEHLNIEELDRRAGVEKMYITKKSKEKYIKKSVENNIIGMSQEELNSLHQDVISQFSKG